VNEVADDIEGTPRRVAFIPEGPRIREIAQKRVEDSGRPGEQRYRVLQIL
jgi:hypothetical protein